MKDTPVRDLFLKKPGIFWARTQILKSKPVKYIFIVAQFLVHKPVNFVSLMFEFHCSIFKSTETLILNANTSNIKQFSGPEKSKKLPLLSRNGTLV